MDVCSHHPQEERATPEKELAYALATDYVVLDTLQAQVSPAAFPAMTGHDRA